MSELNGSQTEIDRATLSDRRIEPKALIIPPKKIDLNLVDMPVAGDLEPVEQLVVREQKGSKHKFTSNYDSGFQVRGLPYEPTGSYETQYQIVAGAALNHPQVAHKAQMIAFVPVYSWKTFEVVLMPVKTTSYGQRVLMDLGKLRDEFPKFKAYLVWDVIKKRHVVYRLSLTDSESEVIARVNWPDRDAIIGALELVAFDSVESLCEANEDIRDLLSAQEV